MLKVHSSGYGKRCGSSVVLAELKKMIENFCSAGYIYEGLNGVVAFTVIG